MIKVSSQGEGVESLLGEYIGVFRVLWRECYFGFLGGNSEFRRESGLVDV